MKFFCKLKSNVKILTLCLLSISSIKTYAAEKDLYDFLWLDPDKKVYVLQNKIHKKYHTVYAAVGLGTGLSSTFQDTTHFTTNLGFYFLEEWSIEGMYTKYSNKNNDAYKNLTANPISGTVPIPFVRNTVSNYGFLVKWDPFYGKINTFNKIIYFDWAFALGYGKLNTESNAKNVAGLTSKLNFDSESYGSVIGKTELTIHVNKYFHVSLGLILNNYKAPGPTSQSGVAPAPIIRQNMDSMLTFGVSY